MNEQVATQIKERFEDLILALRFERQDAEAGPHSRHLAVTITELEKAYAYYMTFVHDDPPIDYRPPRPL